VTKRPIVGGASREPPAQRASKSGSRFDCSAIRPSQAQGFGEGSAGTAVDSKKQQAEV